MITLPKSWNVYDSLTLDTNNMERTELHGWSQTSKLYRQGKEVWFVFWDLDFDFDCEYY